MLSTTRFHKSAAAGWVWGVKEGDKPWSLLEPLHCCRHWLTSGTETPTPAAAYATPVIHNVAAHGSAGFEVLDVPGRGEGHVAVAASSGAEKVAAKDQVNPPVQVTAHLVGTRRKEGIRQ